ncbi:MAG: AMP-binding protein, partial [Promethearchaeota archaeon]
MDEMYWQSGPRWPEHARKTLEYPKEPVFAMLDRAAEKSGNLPYTVFSGKSRTFSEVRETADRIANFLASRGIKEGDRVALFLPNVPHFPPAFFGALKAGAKVVTCNPMYKAGELRYQLTDTDAVAIFALDHPVFTPICYEGIKDTSVETVVVCSVKSFLPKVEAVLGGLLGKIPKSPYYEEDKTFFFDDIVTQ